MKEYRDARKYMRSASERLEPGNNLNDMHLASCWRGFHHCHSVSAVLLLGGRTSRRFA